MRGCRQTRQQYSIGIKGEAAENYVKICVNNVMNYVNDGWRRRYQERIMRFLLSFFLFAWQLGNDEWATKYDENLKKYGVDTRLVHRVDGQKTGMALVNVAENGENHVIFVPGANNSLSSADVENADELLKASKVNKYAY